MSERSERTREHSTYRFDEAVAVRPSGAAGTWDAAVSPTFSVGGRTNGGYLLALAAQAAVAQVEADGGAHAEPIVLAGTFVTSAPAGPVQVDVEPLREGRGSSVLRARVRGVDGTPHVEASITCGRLPEPGAGHHYDAVPPPPVPSPQQCVRLSTQGPGFEVLLMGELAEELEPSTLGWAQGRPGGGGELRGWVSFDDGRPVDALSLVLIADALPPATFDLGLAGWVPTMQLTVFVRARPAPGPVLVRQSARVVSAGTGTGGRTATVDETCDVWDSTGRLVATGHQLAALRLPALDRDEVGSGPWT